MPCTNYRHTWGSFYGVAMATAAAHRATGFAKSIDRNASDARRDPLSRHVNADVAHCGLADKLVELARKRPATRLTFARACPTSRMSAYMVAAATIMQRSANMRPGLAVTGETRERYSSRETVDLEAVACFDPRLDAEAEEQEKLAILASLSEGSRETALRLLQEKARPTKSKGRPRGVTRESWRKRRLRMRDEFRASFRERNGYDESSGMERAPVERLTFDGETVTAEGMGEAMSAMADKIREQAQTACPAFHAEMVARRETLAVADAKRRAAERDA